MSKPIAIPAVSVTYAQDGTSSAAETARLLGRLASRTQMEPLRRTRNRRRQSGRSEKVYGQQCQDHRMKF